MAITIPPANKVENQGGIVTDLDNTYAAVAALYAGNALWDAYAGGADPSGAADSTAAIQAAINSGYCYLPPGQYLLNGTSGLSVSAAGTVLKGAGRGQVKLVIGPSFSDAQAISITTDNYEVADLMIVGASTTVTSNPACKGIVITGGQRPNVHDVMLQYVNGMAVTCAGTAGSFTADAMFHNVIARNCAGGITMTGNSGTSFRGEPFMSNIQLQQIGVSTGPSANLDALLIQDVEDVLLSNVNIGMASSSPGTGLAVHVAGNCATIHFANLDAGGGGTNTMLIEDSGGNSPAHVSICGGTLQQAANGAGLAITGAAIDVIIDSVHFSLNASHGLSLAGSCTDVTVDSCEFHSNNQANTTAYDVNATTTGRFSVRGSRFRTSVGSGAGLVTNPCNDTSHTGVFEGDHFVGSGNTPSTVFAAGGTPQIVRNCQGYNPRGAVTAPTITTGVFTPSTYQGDMSVIFTALNGVTAWKIGGTSLGVPLLGVPYRVPARQSMEVDSSGTAPTWIWLAD